MFEATFSLSIEVVDCWRVSTAEGAGGWKKWDFAPTLISSLGGRATSEEKGHGAAIEDILSLECELEPEALSFAVATKAAGFGPVAMAF